MIMERFLRSPFTMSVFLIGLAVIYSMSIVLEQRNNMTTIIFVAYAIFVIIYFGTMVYFNRKFPDRKIRILTFIPYELKEEDEGHQYITYRACRKVYIYYYFAIPAAIVAVSLFRKVELLPVITLTVLGIGQYFIFWSEVKKLYE
ncbi:hypothetical protein [Cytobacillus firmus]|uniref:hypothetical protein n=1 Tax=Cytobacillus firmus TaxID=1399 RepID=UPI001CFD41CB|nr:hypothetical protein [Cytobacillus firmus]URT68952.1 hypothetical protein NAF01_14140 [Cytobacillus firmus]WHY32218.1 hypothetical protein QNH44_14375 [Cytobacillus firmus]WHY59817.1 hypothetical protein QNH42_14575 [Cytobacillus firmus]